MASKDIIDRIMAAELKARETLEHARVAAEEIRSKARLEAEAEAKSALEAASTRLSEERQAASDAADAEVRASLDAYRAELAALPLDRAAFVELCGKSLFADADSHGRA